MNDYPWVAPLLAQTLASPWDNISDELFGRAMELALDRLEKRGEYREPTSVEVDAALEDLMTDPDYRRAI